MWKFIAVAEASCIVVTWLVFWVTWGNTLANTRMSKRPDPKWQRVWVVTLALTTGLAAFAALLSPFRN